MNISTRHPTATSTTMHLQSEDVAAPAMRSNPKLDAVPQRVREIAMLRGLGYSFRQIAEQFCVTPQAVSLMLLRHRRCLETLRGSIELSALSPRAVNALARHGIRSREQALANDTISLLRGQRNCGRKTLEEVARWMDGSGA